MNLKVILPAGQIPLGEIVTKRTGEKPYKLTDRLRIFDPASKPQEVRASEGILFLAHDGDANAIKDDQELVWETDSDRLWDWVTQLAEGPPK